MAASILIADDDAVARRLVENMVQKCGYETIVVDSGDAAIAMLTAPEAQAIDAVVLDLVMPGLDGMGVLAKIREAGLNIPVIVQTAHGGIDNVVSAMRAGAQDFVVKPVGIERLQVSLRNALNASALKGELQRIRHSREGRLTFADIITRSETMAGVLRTAQKATASTIPVLIEGESGVGKELFARAIHGSGERKSKPFVAVNCGAIPDNLVESILFGHEKGAFTGATERHMGKFVEASGGTLFLDEVSELPLAAQVKLLRALQEGAVEAVGGRKPVKVDVRIISATNRKLLDRVKGGQFREDLFYRLHVLPLTIPPLRMRREDIPHLLRHFLARFCAEENRPISGISGEAMAHLSQLEWPGNIRQLENVVYRAVVMSDGDQLGLADFPLAAQVKLLRALQEGAVEAVGGRKPVKVDVRIISATNRKLLDRVKGGQFREDLFYRLHVLPLTIPPLRARREDIPHLLRHFLARFCAEENRPITGINGEAMAQLAQLEWPGNIRQLENVVYRAVVMSDGDQLGLADFPLAAAQSPTAPESQSQHGEPLIVPPAFHSTAPAMVSGNDIPIAPLPAAGMLAMLTRSGEMRPLEEMETEIIRFAISHYRGQMSEVARRLKIGRSTLYRKLDEAAANDPVTGGADAAN